ncbi:MAG: DEAD/DEAH box helicase [Bacteroidetes bacterium]|nr:DEAD/DEAH box helicase [Bacteroidota bacterium]
MQVPVIIIGTAGRLLIISDEEILKLIPIHLLILDEFDKSMELGFQEEMAFIIQSLKNVTRKR